MTEPADIKCECGEDADRECARCEAPLCDSCDKGDETDQESLCAECKGEKEEYYSNQNTEYWEGLQEDLNWIKENTDKVLAYWQGDVSGKYMFLKKAFAVLDHLDWDLGTIRTDRQGKRLRELVIGERDVIVSLSKKAKKEAA
jgi:hypothetical protein